MDLEDALKVMEEYQAWRLGEDPYNHECLEQYVPFKYEPREITEALQVAIKTMRESL